MKISVCSYYSSYVITFVGCTVMTTCALLVFPHPYTYCRYNCNRRITCIAFEPVEWLYPNLTVINQTDQGAKIYGMSSMYLVIRIHIASYM